MIAPVLSLNSPSTTRTGYPDKSSVSARRFSTALKASECCFSARAFSTSAYKARPSCEHGHGASILHLGFGEQDIQRGFSPSKLAHALVRQRQTVVRVGQLRVGSD